jgi:Domain of unknown function (DUF4124)
MRTVATASAVRRRWPGFAALALAAACVWPAHATIYKCQGPAGVPLYQDSPCPAGKELRDFDKDPPTVSVMPLTPAPLPGTTTRQVLPPAPSASKVKNGARAKAAAFPPGKASERKFIAPGINEGEVMARLGTPDMKSGGGGRKLARWTYLPAPEDPGTVTTLTFESGRLVEVERKVVK